MENIFVFLLGLFFLSLFKNVLTLESKNYNADKILRILFIGLKPIHKLLPSKEMPWAEFSLLLMKINFLLLGFGFTGISIYSFYTR